MGEAERMCPACGAPVGAEAYFCGNCGKKLSEPPLATSWGKQIFVYVISILVPPLGLWWAVPYLRQKDAVSKRIGVVIIALTVISLVVTIWSAIALTEYYTQLITSVANLH